MPELYSLQWSDFEGGWFDSPRPGMLLREVVQDARGIYYMRPAVFGLGIRVWQKGAGVVFGIHTLPTVTLMVRGAHGWIAAQRGRNLMSAQADRRAAELIEVHGAESVRMEVDTYQVDPGIIPPPITLASVIPLQRRGSLVRG